MNDAVRRHVRVLRVGSHAARVLSSEGSARVAAVFERSLLIEGQGGFVTIGASSIGSGPLNGIAEETGIAIVLRKAGALGLTVGARVDVEGGMVSTGHLVLDASSATHWRAPPWPKTAEREDILATADAIVARAKGRAPSEGLARLALLHCHPEGGLRAACDGAAQQQLGRHARPGLDALRAYLARRGDGEQAVREAAQIIGLIGLGPGLTPSGDDLLGGVLLMLAALDETGLRDALGSVLRPQLATRTSALSGQFLEAAIAGEGSEVIHGLAGAIAAGAVEAAVRWLDPVGQIGHTSGWDAAAGLVVAAQSLLEGDAT